MADHSNGRASRTPREQSVSMAESLTDVSFARRCESQGERYPPYTPQFSTATSLILERLKSGSQGLDSALSSLSTSIPQPGTAAFEDARNRLVQSMNTIVSGPLPAASSPTPQAAVDAGAKPSPPPVAGQKRKHSSEPEKVDFTQNTISFPWVNRPRLSSSPSRPSPTREEQQKPQAKVASHRQQEIEKHRQKRLSTLPEGVVPAKPELVGFSAGRASDAARTEYFNDMKRTDLLNILSLCDQLKPQLLADVLVSVSKRHPDLPMFNSPDWETHVSGAMRPNPNLSGKGLRPDGTKPGRSLINSKARNKQKTTKKILKRTRVIEVTTDFQDEDNAMPPTWPKADEGMYSKLPPDTEDKEVMEDENDEEAFSHFMVCHAGKQIIAPVGA